MKVKELKEVLSKFNDEDEVVIMNREEIFEADFVVKEKDDYYFKGDEEIKGKCIVMWWMYNFNKIEVLLIFT